MKEAYNKGCENFVEYATYRLYELICQNCSDNNISSPEGRINYEYDKATKIGRVWTDDLVIILNEFGTGIKGTQDEWANRNNYEVNKSGKGESGWWYPTTEDDPNPYKWTDPNGQLRALTHGLPSRHMFYDALLKIQSEFNEMINIEIEKALGDLY